MKLQHFVLFSWRDDFDNRVRSSIKAVSNAIVDYVNETKPLDEGINGRTSPRRRMVWLESSFVGEYGF